MLQLTAQKREIFGKKVKNLLTQGLIPAEIYGHGFENFHLAVSSKDFLKVWKEAGESSLVNVEVGGEKYPTLIHDVQHDLLGDRVIHIDFYHVRMDEKIRTHVPISFIGEPIGVREKGGILVKSVDKLEIEALPINLPSFLEVDISSLSDIHQSARVGDIKIPEGVRLLTDLNTVVATIIEKAKEEAPPPVAEVAPTPEGEMPESEIPAPDQKETKREA